MLDENIMQFQVSGLKTREEVLAYLGQVMVDCGVVYESYPTAVLEREKIFPTGLQFQDYGIAIPHTDVERVKKAQLAIMTLDQPVEFYQMGTSDVVVPVQVVFMLALKEAHQQLTLLQDLVALLQDSQAMAAICQLPNQPESQEVLGMILAQHGIL